jgi:hypothetical protein
MRVRAFAKINLSLRVLGTRADGYHELRTVFQSIALHDTLTIRASRGPFSLTCGDPGCPTDETNLIWRAAARMWAAAGRRGAPRDVAIDLAKRIPMQAGLGGGSSNAAAALRALARRWRVGETRVREAAVALGADVPYFLEGGTVLGLERGDLLFPLIDVPAAWVVLVLPDFGVSTKDAFGWFDGDCVPDVARGVNAPRGGPHKGAPHRGPRHRTTWSTISRRRSSRGTRISGVSFRHSAAKAPLSPRCLAAVRPYSACFPIVPTPFGPPTGWPQPRAGRWSRGPSTARNTTDLPPRKPIG